MKIYGKFCRAPWLRSNTAVRAEMKNSSSEYNGGPNRSSPELVDMEGPESPYAHMAHINATGYEVIDAPTLASRWAVPASWVREQARTRATDPIPHLKLGRYLRFEWGSPELERWFGRHRVNRHHGR